jgi:Putative peptidoglycan binding domain
MNGSSTSSGKKLLMGVGLLIVIAAILYAIIHNDQAVNNNPNACINKTFKLGATGKCISDGQNLLNWYLYGIDQPNYMKVNETFSLNTQVALKKAQSGASLAVNGQFDPATWKLLCRSDDPPAWWVTAAKNAGCPSP